MLLNLKLFRVAHNLTQEEMADKLNVSRSVYSNIERGRNRGADFRFWSNLQKAFNISNEEMFRLMKPEERAGKCGTSEKQ